MTQNLWCVEVTELRVGQQCPGIKAYIFGIGFWDFRKA
jgi:hypothetical protein